MLALCEHFFILVCLEYSWSSYEVYAPLIIGIVFFILFGLYEWKGRDDGLLHHEMFKKSRNTWIVLLLIFVEGLLSFGYIVRLFFQRKLILSSSRYNDDRSFGLKKMLYFGNLILS